jgi:hypothetical protein
VNLFIYCSAVNKQISRKDEQLQCFLVSFSPINPSKHKMSKTLNNIYTISNLILNQGRKKKGQNRKDKKKNK